MQKSKNIIGIIKELFRITFNKNWNVFGYKLPFFGKQYVCCLKQKQTASLEK